MVATALPGHHAINNHYQMAIVKLSILSSAEKMLQKTIVAVMWFSCCSLAGMMLILAIDVFLRSAIDVVVPGTIEIIQFLMVLVVFLSLAYTSLGRGHVTIRLVSSRFPERIQVGLDSFASLLGVLLFAGIGWQLGLRGWDNIFATNPLNSFRLHVPYYPFYFMAALGSILLALHLLVNFCHSLIKIVRK